MRIYPKLEIGAGSTAKREGWINADFYPGPNIDAVFDACGPWPFDDNSIGSVSANHVLEHLNDPFAFFAEAWRVLAPTRLQTPNLFIRVPYGPSEGGLGDITHIKHFVPTSFACVQQGYGDHIKNPQYRNKAAPFEVLQIYKRIHPDLAWMMKPLVRKASLKILPYMWGGYCELIVGLRPLKNGETVQDPGTIPVVNMMYRHEYEGRELNKGESMKTMFFGGKEAKELQRMADQKEQK